MNNADNQNPYPLPNYYVPVPTNPEQRLNPTETPAPHPSYYPVYYPYVAPPQSSKQWKKVLIGVILSGLLIQGLLTFALNQPAPSVTRLNAVTTSRAIPPAPRFQKPNYVPYHRGWDKHPQFRGREPMVYYRQGGQYYITVQPDKSKK